MADESETDIASSGLHCVHGTCRFTQENPVCHPGCSFSTVAGPNYAPGFDPALRQSIVESCERCEGRGEVGGFVSGSLCDGYQTDGCQHCGGTGLKDMMAGDQPPTVCVLTPTPEEWDMIARSHILTASGMPKNSPGYARHQARAQEIIQSSRGAGWFYRGSNGDAQ